MSKIISVYDFTSHKDEGRDWQVEWPRVQQASNKTVGVTAGRNASWNVKHIPVVWANIFHKCVSTSLLDQLIHIKANPGVSYERP